MSKPVLQMLPSCFGRHPEDAMGEVFVQVLRVGASVPLGLQLDVGLLEDF